MMACVCECTFHAPYLFTRAHVGSGTVIPNTRRINGQTPHAGDSCFLQSADIFVGIFVDGIAVGSKDFEEEDEVGGAGTAGGAVGWRGRGAPPPGFLRLRGSTLAGVHGEGWEKRTISPPWINQPCGPYDGSGVPGVGEGRGGRGRGLTLSIFFSFRYAYYYLSSRLATRARPTQPPSPARRTSIHVGGSTFSFVLSSRPTRPPRA
jgi:hypothetical protein